MRALRTLFLTPWMAYHRVAHWQVGVTEVVTGKVDVVEEYEALCASPSIELRIPAVVRLRKEVKQVHKPRYSPKNIFIRDGFRCCYCGKVFHRKELNLDHVLPRSRGGKTSWENVVTSCHEDNTRKGSKTPAEAGLRMHFQPYVPNALPTTAPFLMDAADIPEQWIPYVRTAAFARSSRAA